MRVQTNIREKLNHAFAPEQLDVEDESHKHAGHAGARPQGESHFKVTIVSSAFEGLNRVDRQRRIYAVLDDDLKTDIHALALVVRAPSEVA